MFKFFDLYSKSEFGLYWAPFYIFIMLYVYKAWALILYYTLSLPSFQATLSNIKQAGFKNVSVYSGH